MGGKLLAAGRAADGSTSSSQSLADSKTVFTTLCFLHNLRRMTLGLKTFNIMMNKMRHSA
jgi:hypothetical protein